MLDTKTSRNPLARFAFSSRVLLWLLGPCLAEGAPGTAGIICLPLSLSAGLALLGAFVNPHQRFMTLFRSALLKQLLLTQEVKPFKERLLSPITRRGNIAGTCGGKGFMSSPVAV